MKTRYAGLVLTVLACVMLAYGCTQAQKTQTGKVAGAVAQAETFQFKFRKLTKDGNGLYPVSMPYKGLCLGVRVSEAELIGAFKGGTIKRRLDLVTADWSFTIEHFAVCNNPTQVRFFGEPDLGGVIDGRYLHRPDVNVEYSRGGVLVLTVRNTDIRGNHPSLTRGTGAINPDRIEIKGSVIGEDPASVYKADFVGPFVAVNVLHVLPNPDRVAGNFAATLKKASGDTELLVVWDGEFVLRRDI